MVIRKGTEVVQQTGEGFEQTPSSIEHVSGQIQEVTAITEKAATGTEQTNQSLKKCPISRTLPLRICRTSWPSRKPKNPSFLTKTRGFSIISNAYQKTRSSHDKIQCDFLHFGIHVLHFLLTCIRHQCLSSSKLPQFDRILLC